MRFIPTETFQDEATGQHYVEGLEYTVREEHPQALKDAVTQWIQEGKCKLVAGDDTQRAELGGEGQVT